jgi:hypothetical protein
MSFDGSRQGCQRKAAGAFGKLSLGLAGYKWALPALFWAPGFSLSCPEGGGLSPALEGLSLILFFCLSFFFAKRLFFFKEFGFFA